MKSLPEPTEPLTDVVFRRWRNGRGEDYGNAVLALFPCEPGTYDPGTCSCYAHVGQHSSANYAYCIRATVPVDLYSPDVVALKSELESIGYRLRVLKRSPPWRKVIDARREALQLRVN